MRYLVIRTENLTKHYGQQQGIESINLEVEPGEVFGFLGPRRAGKTTTLRLLLDLMRPSHGRAVVLGMDSQRQGKAIRRQVGYLPDRLALIGRKTGEELLRYLGRPHEYLQWPYVQELAGRLGVDLSRSVIQMKAADWRKIGLIQAFMRQPELLILDEPARGLDESGRQVFYQLVREARAEGRTVFFSSESLAEMERICDRVAVIHAGHLVAVERGVQLRGRALRKIEMRFACPVSPEAFVGLSNLQNLRFEDNFLRCTVQGDPDALIKVASQYRVTDFISQMPTLDEAFYTYYGLGCGA